MRKCNDGILWIFFGLSFFLLTFNLIFPFVMFMMKLVFYCIGGLCIIGGAMQIYDDIKKKKTL